MDGKNKYKTKYFPLLLLQMNEGSKGENMSHRERRGKMCINRQRKLQISRKKKVHVMDTGAM